MARTLLYKYDNHHFRNVTYWRHYCARTKQSLADALNEGRYSLGEPVLRRDETFEWNSEGRAVVSVWSRIVITISGPIGSGMDKAATYNG